MTHDAQIVSPHAIGGAMQLAAAHDPGVIPLSSVRATFNYSIQRARRYAKGHRFRQRVCSQIFFASRATMFLYRPLAMHAARA
jgi:hypothetical protein